MKQWTLNVTAASALLLGSQAHALTGNELLTLMEDTDAAFKTASLAYVRGYIDAVTLDHAYRKMTQKPGEPTQNPMFCSPDSATPAQAKDIVKAYLVAHPERRHGPAGGLTGWALRKAWPCTSDGKPAL